MSNARGDGHYEYAEFVADLGGQVVDKSWNFTSSGGSPDERITVIVEKAVRSLLNEKSQEGWEPTEPITADHLWRAGKVEHKTTNHMWSGKAKHVLYRVRLGFRRWVN